jgi:hypothetical protein
MFSPLITFFGQTQNIDRRNDVDTPDTIYSVSPGRNRSI